MNLIFFVQNIPNNFLQSTFLIKQIAFMLNSKPFEIEGEKEFSAVFYQTNQSMNIRERKPYYRLQLLLTTDLIERAKKTGQQLAILLIG